MGQQTTVFNFAKLMVLAQRRHDARQAATREEGSVTTPTAGQRDEQARRALQTAEPARAGVARTAVGEHTAELRHARRGA